MKQIDAEYYVLLNSDVEVSHHWLTLLIEFMDSHQAGRSQPKSLAEYDKDSFEYVASCGGFLDKYGYPFCRGRIFDTVERDNGQDDYQQEDCGLRVPDSSKLLKGLFHVAVEHGRFSADTEERDFVGVVHG